VTAAGDGSALMHYVRVLRRGAWVIVLMVALGGAAGYYLSVRQSKLFEASAHVFLNSQDLATSLSNIQLPSQDPVREAQTQADLARTLLVAERAIKLAGTKGVTPDALLENSSVTPASNADLLTFTVDDEDPARAVLLSTSYAKGYTSYRRAIDTDSLVRARREVQERITELDTLGERRSALYANLAEKYQQLRTMEVLQQSNALLVRTARSATQIQPKPERNSILGGVLGFVLGIGIAFLLDALNTRVRSSREIEEQIDLPLLGRIPEPRRSRPAERLVMLANAHGPQAETYRILAANLDFVNVDRDARSIMITSARHEEGKSTTLANLAIALALAGRRVVLVDLDLRRPTLHKLFDLSDPAGLTQVLVRKTSLEDALIPVPILEQRGDAGGNGSVAGLLEVLPAGPTPPNPAEAIRSHAVAEILSDLERRADVLLVDAPPLLGLSDSISLSARVDALIIAVRLQGLRRGVLEELTRVLDTVPTVKLGYVLTGAQADAGYGYGYAYGYGYGRSERAEARTRARVR
jgi:succinoglycan biosynthesis transport protein ExoP